VKEKFKSTDLAADENASKIIGDLKYLNDLYTEKIQQHVRINTLWKTGISKTLHRFQRYCKQKYKRCKEKITNPDLNYFSTESTSDYKQWLVELKQMVNISKEILRSFKAMIHQWFFEYKK